jgi:rhodanese-related sulfurtransferase
MNTKWILFFLISACCYSCELRSQETKLDVSDFAAAIENAPVQILDVRTSGEFARGHIKGAMQANWNDRNEFEERTKALDKLKPIYIYCAAGPRSDAAGAWLSKKGFEIVHLKGGIAAWQRSKRELVSNNNYQVEQIDPDDFLASLPKDKPVLVDIGAEWCPPCRKMIPVVDSLETIANGRFGIMRVDVTSQPALTEYLKADSYPTFVIFRNGKEVWRRQGILALKELEAALLNP